MDWYALFMKQLILDNLTYSILIVTLGAILYYLYQKIVIPYNFIQGTGNFKDEIHALRRLRKVGEKLPPPFPNAWFRVAESNDVKRGQVIEVHCLGMTLAVFRSHDGIAHVLDAHCPHLGANIARGGTVQGDCLKCPFHGWEFSGKTGQCVLIPDVETIPKKANVKKWTSVEVNNLILVWHSADGDEPTYEIPAVQEIVSGKYKLQGRNEFHVTCHIQEILENGGDLAHLNSIHGNSLFTKIYDIGSTKWNFIDVSHWSGEWEVTEKPYIALMRISHSITFFRRLQIPGFKVIAYQVGPTMVMMEFICPIFKVCVLQSVTPVSPLQQKVIHNLFCSSYCKPLANLIMWGETVMYARDVAVWQYKSYLHDPLYVKTDKSLKNYRNWYRQFYSENSTSFEDAIANNYNLNATLDW